MRMKGGRDATHIPVFEGARKAVAVVDVARARPGQVPKISSVPVNASDIPISFKIGEPAGSAAQPVLCFKSVTAACQAKFLSTSPKMAGLPHGVDRMICVFQVGAPGEGVDSILSSSPAGRMVCSCVTPIALKPLPSGAVGEAALPRPSYWVPGGGMHALD